MTNETAPVAAISDVQFDANGLVPAIVQDATTRDVLMVAYMNAESLRRTLDSGRTWFYSRSRQELWAKGDTSGNTQIVRRVVVDCDADAILVEVDQQGVGACHTGDWSCFVRQLDLAARELSALDLPATYDAIHHGVVGTEDVVEVVCVSGPDALSYMQGQVSQDLAGLANGESVETLILSPQGKLDAYCRVVRTADDAMVVVVEDGFGQATFDRLRRFKLRVKADIELARWQRVRVCGAENVAGQGPSGTVAALPFAYPGLVGVDYVGPQVTPPADLPSGDRQAFELARIEAGVPSMASDINEKTIPQEAGIVERTVSFTKGCYTGQELVARIDARGNRVAKRLVGLLAADSARAGDAIVHSGREVGVLTSAAASPRTGGTVALGYLQRAVEVPAAVLVGDQPAEALALPLYRD